MKATGEDRLVELLRKHMPLGGDVLVGPGDDCALVELDGAQLLLKTDCVVESVHFDAACQPARVGRKALARVLSDIAAMAGDPGPALVTVGASELMDGDWLLEAYRGMEALATRFGVSLAGGESARMPGCGMLSVAMTSRVRRRPLLRSGGGNGDLLYVSGELGGSLASGWHLDFEPRIHEAQWLARNFRPSAMLDLSDGLAADLPRLAAASGTGFVIERGALPLRAGCTPGQALSDGEDYELLFAIPAACGNQLEREWSRQFPRLALSCIGELRDGAHEELGGGYDHFARQASA